VCSLGLSARNQSMEVEKTRSTPSVRWQQISTSNSSMMASTTRTQTITGGEGDSAVWPPDLRFDIKNPPPVSRGGLTITRDPFRCRSGRIPLRETTLPRFGRLARASAPLSMQIQNMIFIDGSREPLSAVGGRPVHVINAGMRIRAQKVRTSASFRAGRLDGSPGYLSPASKRLPKPNRGDRSG
jgi:hypothetical protein